MKRARRALLVYVVADGVYWGIVKPKLRRSLGMV